ncbi:MAG: lipoyl synthase [Candidatus Omnitrophota bacterium]|nr:lipoyl synthase [Candidatus Omnitrophota bacterium]
MQNAILKSHSKRFPYWLRQSVRDNEGFSGTKDVISRLGLNTVCQSARCPNIYDCFSAKRCTFLILGASCTRSCGFCAVKNGNSKLPPQPRRLRPVANLQPQPTRLRWSNLNPPDKEELFRIKEAIERLGITHAIITSVTRDDLADGGAGHFADCVNILKGIKGSAKIEVLVPDFCGDRKAIEKVISARPDIFSHNLETAPRLYSKVRPGADYRRSLEILKYAKALDKGIITKSGIMVGLGEFREEVRGVMADIRAVGCDIVTVGQYLKPGPDCLDVEEFLEPWEFDKFSEWARELGFKKYYCGPFVRSSYVF